MKTRLRHLMTVAIWLLSAVIASGSGAVLGASVACVSFDDHIDEESFFAGCCVITNPEIQGRGVTAAPANSCGECVDVQLKVSPFKSANSQLSPPDNNNVCTVCSPCFRRSHAAPSADAVDHIDRHWQSLSALSSVILRT